jgi:hypothetical protein
MKGKEIFLYYRYSTEFRRRAGWRLLPLFETSFTMGELFEWRALTITATGNPGELGRLERDYRFDIRCGRGKSYSVALIPLQESLADTHSRVMTLPLLPPARRLNKRQIVTVRMHGKPFKLSARMAVQVNLEGVQVFNLKSKTAGTDNSESPDSEKGKGGAK